jgi:predicted RNA-binding protein YlxR (DUF448 family)
MHATLKLTWCCCDKARAAKERQMITRVRASKERQMMARVQEQGRAAQVNINIACNEQYCVHTAFRNAAW